MYVFLIKKDERFQWVVYPLNRKRKTKVNNEVVEIKAMATGESFIEGFEPQKACDGKKDTAWMADPYFKWLILDCKEAHFIDHIKLVTGHEGEFYHYHVEYSLDRINWYFVSEKSDDTKATEDGDTIKICKEARYIRITVSFCSKGSTVKVENVSLYGYKTDSQEETDDITKKRVKAVSGTIEEGFKRLDDYDIDASFKDSVVEAIDPGAVLKFSNVDFKNGEFNQLRFCLGLPIKDKVSYVNIEFRLDSKDGEKVGNIHLCRQYTYFTELAIEIKKETGEAVTGKHDFYAVVTQIDKPQSVVFYWFYLTKEPVLSKKTTDYKEKLIVDDKPYQIFFGNMHSHTGLTDGFGTAEHAYDYARNVAKLDFLGITEHSNCLDEMFDYDKSFKWRDLKATSEKATEDGKFVGLYGSETTWYNQFGHMNVYCADFYLNSYEFKFDVAKNYYDKLKEFPGIISQWNHPWSCGNRHFDMFEPYDEELDKITYTIELNNVEMTGYDVIKYYVIALDKGWHLAPVGNQDNHGENWGTWNGIRTGLFARRLTAADIFDAMKNFRTYFTGTPGFRVIYTMNGHLQGAILDWSDDLTINVKASCDDKVKITKIEVYSEGGRVIDTKEVSDSEIDVSLKVKEKLKYYFLELYREDGQVAVTAPIWIK